MNSNKFFCSVSIFANVPWKKNFLCMDSRQIDQNSRNFGKLAPQRFAFNKIEILKVIF